MSSHSTAKTVQRLGILFPLLIIYLLFNLSYAVEAQDEKSVTNVGAIIDVDSRIGKQQKAAMEIAAENFNNQSETDELILHFRDSGRDPFLAAYAAEHLMKEEKVQVIIGMETWQEAVTVADVVKNKNLSDDQVVPVISFAAPTITPPLIQRLWPFLIRMGSDVAAQMACIGDIVSAYYWKRVVVVYEDDGYGGGIGRLALLSETLRDVGAKIEHRIVLPRISESTDPYWDEVERQFKLSNVQSRTFIVLQSSLPTVTGLFKVAKKMGLVGVDSAWIITEGIASLLDPQGNHDMEGTLGIKTYYDRNTTTYASFQKEFRTKYSDEDNSKPGIYALRAYDIISIITQAISKMNTKTTNTSLQELLAERLSNNYKGLSGIMQLKGGEVLLDSPRFRIINIVDGKTDKELNIWTPGFGFSKSLVKASGTYRSSDNVGDVTWPGNMTLRPSKGWAMPTVEKKMKIAIPTQNSPFITVLGDNRYDGFCIQLFNMVVGNLSHLYSLPHEFYEFNGNFSDLIELVNDKTYDAIVGDMTVLVERIDKVEFTQPYLESGLTMIVPDISAEEETWMFMKPFTWQMWVVTGSILIYTMLIVWFLERPTNPDFRGPLMDQIGTAVWFTFSSLFFAHREKVFGNLTRVVFLIWLFVVLILTSSYTANLSSMLTVQRLQPNVTDMQMLVNSSSSVGVDGDSFLYTHMKDVIGFKPDNLINVSSDYSYSGDFKNRTISAAFLELPYADVFLNTYCEGYTATTPALRFGGLSFIFQKGSPIARDFTKAILELLENGEIKKLQNEWLTPEEECSKNSTHQPKSLKLSSFSGLYAICGATSTFCLLLSLAMWMRRFQLQDTNEGSASPSDENIWNKTVRIVKFFKIRDLEIPTRAPTFASYVVDLTTPRRGEYSPTSNNPEQPPAFTPAEIECMPVEQTETRV